MTSLTLKNDPEFNIYVKELDEKFWKTVEYELQLHFINSKKTISELNNGNQSKFTNRSGNNLPDVN